MTATAAPTSVGRRCRPATPADAAACARVNLTTWRETYGHQLPDAFWSSQTLTARTLAWTERLDGGVPVTIAEVDDEVVGRCGSCAEPGALTPERELRRS